MTSGLSGFDGETTAVRDLISFLRRRALHMAGSDSDAWDLVQDTLERAVHQWPSSWSHADLRKWVTVVLRHLNIDRVRSAAWRASLTVDPDGVDLLPAPEPEELPLWKTVDSDRIAEGLARLSEAHRRLLLMQIDGKSLREIAETTGIHPSTVGTQLFRAKKQMRAILGLPPAAPRLRRRRSSCVSRAAQPAV